ncbi:TetR/AcrR family transcriptional regulator [Planobispora siamensis]|uniref:TetR family transcriptional regulator n=1 Tax=Planobispora siamensis TaxID=936338 RepID=A0A8J3WJX0_9ACTN|nr:TetR/AcrR family transcriptional regulator [Planobispora siamensis]GIH93424.1 TetR family transcriptional regulator [Planobispora siamensis]
MVKAGRPSRDPARQLERAHRILDAVAELILRWGYDKTTIDDVARRAGVAKGTIYLHWKTRDDIFAALLRRERVRMLAQVRERAPATLSGLFGEFARGVLGRPLLKAALTGDSEVLGKLVREKRDDPARLQIGGAYEDYLAELVKHGALRPDAGEHMLIVNSIVYGFLCLPDTLPEGARPSGDRIADLVADTIERALGTGRDLPAADAEAVARATAGFLEAAAELAGRKLALSMEV